MIVTTSWDDGDILDERLVELLTRYGMRGTFYISRTYRPRRLSEDRIRVLAAKHEIGAHTINHLDLTRLSDDARKNEIVGSKNWLEDVTGDAVTMFCYPFGLFDAEVKQMVATAGFRAARTTCQFGIGPYRDRFAMPTTLQVHPTLVRRASARDFRQYLLGRGLHWGSRLAPLRITGAMLLGWSHFAETLLKAARTLDDSNIFHLWGHSWEIDAAGMWGRFDALLNFIQQLGCRVRTNGELWSD